MLLFRDKTKTCKLLKLIILSKINFKIQLYFIIIYSRVYFSDWIDLLPYINTLLIIILYLSFNFLRFKIYSLLNLTHTSSKFKIPNRLLYSASLLSYIFISLLIYVRFRLKIVAFAILNQLDCIFLRFNNINLCYSSIKKHNVVLCSTQICVLI